MLHACSLNVSASLPRCCPSLLHSAIDIYLQVSFNILWEEGASFSFIPCSWLNTPHPSTTCVHLMPVDGILFGKQVFAAIMKVRIWRGDHLGLSGQDLSPVISVLIRARPRRGWGHTEEKAM